MNITSKADYQEAMGQMEVLVSKDINTLNEQEKQQLKEITEALDKYKLFTEPKAVLSELP